MDFSNLDIISKERELINNRRDAANMRWYGRLFNTIIYPRNPKYTFYFYVPHYTYIRSMAFCEDIAEEIAGNFKQSDLAEILLIDFLEYVKKKNDIHGVYNKLRTRDLAPASVKHYNTEEVSKGIMFEEFRGFELVFTHLDHKDALRVEFILRDMMEIYPDHNYILENVLEIAFCDFVDDYRKGIIKNPMRKILQYV